MLNNIDIPIIHKWYPKVNWVTWNDREQFYKIH